MLFKFLFFCIFDETLNLLTLFVDHNSLIRRCKLVTIVSSADLFATVSPHYENGDTVIVNCSNEHMQREQTNEKLGEINERNCPMNTFRIRSVE